MARGIERVLPDVELTFIGLEFATRPTMEVLTALPADHWLHAQGGADPALRTRIQRQMRDAFLSESPAWQAAVYGRTAPTCCSGRSAGSPPGPTVTPSARRARRAESRRRRF